MLADWHDRIVAAKTWLENAVTDSHAQVRLEAVNALRQIGTREAVELALRAIDQPTDTWLDFALFRTAHELRDAWLPDFQAGKGMFQGNPQRVAFALSSVGGETSLAPLAELVRERRVRDDQLVETLTVLASFGNTEQRQLVLDRMPELSADGIRHLLTAFVQSGRGELPANASSIEDLFDSGAVSLKP